MATIKRFIAKNGLDNNSNTIINVSDPVNAQDAATKAFSSNAANLTSGVLPSARLPAFTGDATSTAGSTALTLATTGVTAGSYSNLSLTVDAKGRITSINSNSSIDGIAIGSTTPSTGAFTTLSASSTVTLSGGTANGVAYLNASKQVTSGSALTFDGTNFTSTRTQITTAGTPPASGAGIELVGGTTPVLLTYNRGTSAYLPLTTSASAHTWTLSGSDAMVLTSTGLGIGTSSPNYSLTSYKGGAVANYLQVASGATGAGAANGLLLGVDSSGNSVINAQGAINLYTYVAGVLRTTIDSSGNLGLGVAPSAWAGKALQIGNATNNWASIGYDANGVGFFSTSAYNNTGSSWIYSASGFAATLYAAGSGAHQWYTAPSGTAGNAISFTQAMTLDASGNLLVGTTSTIGRSAAGNTHIQGSTNDNASGVMWLRNSNAASGKYFHIGPVNDNGFVVYNQSSVGMYMADGATSWTANSDERMKTELTPFENAVEKVASLRAGTGRYLTDEEGVSRSFLIAQDVQNVLPEAVNVQNDERGTLGLQYTDVIPLLVAAIKELKTELDELKSQLGK